MAAVGQPAGSSSTSTTVRWPASSVLLKRLTSWGTHFGRLGLPFI
jgi:hypothetical protein